MNQREHKDRLEEIFWEKFNETASDSEEWSLPSNKLDSQILNQVRNEKNNILLPLILFFIGALVVGSFALYFTKTYIQQNNNLRQVEELFNVPPEPKGQEEINGIDIIFCDSSIYEVNITYETNLLQASLLMEKVDARTSLPNVERLRNKEQLGSTTTHHVETHRLNNAIEAIMLNDDAILEYKVQNSIVEQDNLDANALSIGDKLQDDFNANWLSLMPLKKNYPLLSTNFYALAPSSVAIPQKLAYHKWSFEMMGGKFINLKPNTLNATTEEIDFTINKSVQVNNFGVNVERKINNRLFVGLGVHYLTSSFITDYGMKVAYDITNEQEIPEGYTNAIQQVIPSLHYDIHGTMLLFRPKHTTLLGNTYIPMSLSLYQKMSSWNIPIYAKGILSAHGRWTTYGKMGIAANFVQHKLSITDYAAILPLNQTLQLEHRELHFTINPSKSSITSRLEINYFISAGFRYSIANSSYIFVESLAQAAFNTTYAIPDLKAKDQVLVGVLLGVGTFF